MPVVDISKLLEQAKEPAVKAKGDGAVEDAIMGGGSGAQQSSEGNGSNNHQRLSLQSARLAHLAFDSSSLVLLISCPDLTQQLLVLKDNWHKQRPKVKVEDLVKNRQADLNHPMGGGRTSVLVCAFLDHVAKSVKGSDEARQAATALLAMDANIHTLSLVELFPKHGKPKKDRKWIWNLVDGFMASDA